MLQPAIAFFEEGFGLNRRVSVALPGLLTFIGTNTIIFSRLTVMDTVDNYASNIGIPLLALFEVVVFVYILRVSQGMKEATYGADMPLPRIFGFVITYITPVFLLVILGSWIYQQVDLYFFGDWVPYAQLTSEEKGVYKLKQYSITFMIGFFLFLVLLQSLAWLRMQRRYYAYQKALSEEELD